MERNSEWNKATIKFGSEAGIDEQRIIAVAGSDFSNTNDGTACFRNKQSPWWEVAAEIWWENSFTGRKTVIRHSRFSFTIPLLPKRFRKLDIMHDVSNGVVIKVVILFPTSSWTDPTASCLVNNEPSFANLGAATRHGSDEIGSADLRLSKEPKQRYTIGKYPKGCNSYELSG